LAIFCDADTAKRLAELGAPDALSSYLTTHYCKKEASGGSKPQSPRVFVNDDLIASSEPSADDSNAAATDRHRTLLCGLALCNVAGPNEALLQRLNVLPTLADVVRLCAYACASVSVSVLPRTVLMVGARE
jgi:hypothetical protein